MKSFEFNKCFPDEAACRKASKEWRDKEGVACQLHNQYIYIYRMNRDRQRVKEFVSRWKRGGDEDSQCQKFWEYNKV